MTSPASPLAGVACAGGRRRQGLDRTMADGKRLSDEQWGAVTGLLESEDRVNLVEGPAGAGKSSLLPKFDEGMRLKGRTPTYLGTTARRPRCWKRTASTPIRSATVPGRYEDAGSRRHRRRPVVIDEASMLGHKDAHRLFRLAEERACG